MKQLQEDRQRMQAEMEHSREALQRQAKDNCKDNKGSDVRGKIQDEDNAAM